IVTAQMVENFLRGGAAVNVLARHAGAAVVVADMGVAGPLPAHPAPLGDPIGPGTRNLWDGAAMTPREAPRRTAAGPALGPAAVGGFEIAGLCGVILAGAASRIPVVLDGFIAGAAALAAVRLKPDVQAYLLASHRSTEPGAAHVLEALGLEPFLDLDMRLGEGTGSALCISLARAAVKIL